MCSALVALAEFQCGFLVYHLPLLGNMMAFIYASKQHLHRNSFIFVNSKCFTADFPLQVEKVLGKTIFTTQSNGEF